MRHLEPWHDFSVWMDHSHMKAVNRDTWQQSGKIS